MSTETAAPGVLEFNHANHEYRLGGRVLPSVTEILADNGFINPTWYTEEGRTRGTDVHALCQFFDEGDYDPKEAERLGLAGYVESWNKLKTRLQLEVLDIEKRMADPVNLFAGTADRLVRQRARRWILDFKSGGKEGWHRYQLGGYEQLYQANGLAGVLRGSVYLKADGSMADLVPHEDDGDRLYFLAFNATTQARRSHGISNSR